MLLAAYVGVTVVTLAGEPMTVQVGAAPFTQLAVGPARALGLVLTAISVVTIVAGPQPRSFTKWGTFWIVWLLPLSTGAVWWLLREAPWSRRAVAIPEPEPRARNVRVGDRQRLGGGWAFVGGAALAVLGYTLVEIAFPGRVLAP